MKEKISKRRNIRRLLSIVLACIMVVTVSPMNSRTVSASDYDVTYDGSIWEVDSDEISFLELHRGDIVTIRNSSSSSITTDIDNPYVDVRDYSNRLIIRYFDSETGYLLFDGTTISFTKDYAPPRKIAICSNPIGNVSVDATDNFAAKGDTVTINAVANSGFAVSGFGIFTSDGQSVAVTKKSATEWTFTMPNQDIIIYSSFSKVDTVAAVNAKIPVFVSLTDDSTIPKAGTKYKFELKAVSAPAGVDAPMPSAKVIELTAPTTVGQANKVGYSGTDANNPWSMNYTCEGSYYYEIDQTTEATTGLTIDEKRYVQVTIEEGVAKVSVSESPFKTDVAEINSNSFAMLKGSTESTVFSYTHTKATSIVLGGGETTGYEAFNKGIIYSNFKTDFSKDFVIKGSFIAGSAADGSVIGFMPAVPKISGDSGGGALSIYNDNRNVNGIFFEFDTYYNGESAYADPDGGTSSKHFSLVQTGSDGKASIVDNQITYISDSNWPTKMSYYEIINDVTNKKLQYIVYPDYDISKKIVYEYSNPTVQFGTNEAYFILAGTLRKGPKGRYGIGSNQIIAPFTEIVFDDYSYVNQTDGGEVLSEYVFTNKFDMHDFEYSVDNNKLSAICKEEKHSGKDCHTSIPLTLSANSMSYSGSAYTGASLDSAQSDSWEDVGIELPVIKYVGRGSTTYTESATAPTNAGTYTAKITMNDKTATADFEIKKADQAATVSMSDYTYGDTPGTPSVSDAKETPDITYYYNTTNSNTGGTAWSGVNATTLEPNTYYLYAELATTTNYKAYSTEPVSFTVGAKIFELMDIHEEDCYTTYDGNPHDASVSLMNNAQGATVTYSETENGIYTDTCPSYTAADTYTVYFKVSKTGYTTKTGTLTIDISPKEITADDIVWSNTSLIYNGSNQMPTATVKSSALCGADTCTVTVTGAQKNASDSAYTATAANVSNSNYKLSDTKPTKDFSIAKKEVGITWGNATFDYDGTKTQAPTATATGLCGTDTCSVTVTGGQTNVGDTYTATAASLGNSNYKLPATGTTKAFEIKAIDMSVSTQDTSVTYDGNAHNITVSVVLPNSVQGEMYTIKYGTTEGTYNYTECPTRTDYGVTTIYYQVTSSNYNTYIGSQKIIIDRKAITGVSATGDDTIYDGANHSITVTKPDAATVTYKTSESGEYTSTNPAYVDKGSYTVYYKVEVDGNYTPVTGQQTVVIEPKEIGLDWGTTEFTYNGSVQTPTATATGLIDGDICIVTVTGGEKEASDSAYTATAADLSDDNYVLPVDVMKTFSIAKKEITVTPKDVKKHIEDEDPKLEYSVIGIVEGDELIGIALEREAGETAGTYEITATSDGTKDTNYNITIGGTGTFTIEGHDWSEFTDDNNANTEYDGTKTATCTCGKKDVKVIADSKVVVETKTTVEETVAIGNGKIVTEAIVDQSVPKTVIENLTTEMAKTLLDADELAAVETGATVTVFLNVVNIENSISADDKAKIENAAKNVAADAKIGLYLDVSLFKKLSTEAGATRITDTNGKKIIVSIAIPDNMINADTNVTRTYYVARIHNGNVELIPAIYDAKTKTITFATDKFSTYAIAYKDVVAKEANVTTPETKTDAPKTGDTTPIVLLFAIMMMSAAGFFALKKKEEK